MSILKGSINNPQNLVGAISSESGITGTVNPTRSLEGQAIPRGNDGISPTVTVDAVDGGHRITIKDIYGTKQIDVMDGQDGYTPEKGKDYYTEAEVQEIVNAVLYEANKHIRAARIGTITIMANKWVGTDSPYSQVVSVEGATENSQVDLTPSVEQLAIFHEKDLAFVTENEDGVVTVYAIGQKPTNDYTIQVTITEVSA